MRTYTLQCGRLYTSRERRWVWRIVRNEGQREEKTMMESGNDGAFPELFGVVRDYAQGDYTHQVQALRVIAAAYLPIFEAAPMPEAREVVEGVLTRNGFLLTNPETGEIEPSSVDAVVSVATSRLDEEDLQWGAGCLLGVMDALRQRAQDAGYETFVLDAKEVLDGLETILPANIVEDVVEDVLDEALEDEDL